MKAQGPMRQAVSLLPSYLSYLESERGFAPLTVDRQTRVLRHFEKWLSGRTRTFIDAKPEDFTAYQQSLSAGGLGPSSLHGVQSILRGLLHYMAIVGHDRKAYFDYLEAPKKGYPLPKTLNRQQVARLMEAPQPCRKLAVRNRAILEILYGAGLRASEVGALKVSEVSLDNLDLRVRGKGSKERIGRMGQTAADWLRKYLTDSRPQLNSKQSDRVFLMLNGKPIGPKQVWEIVNRSAQSVGLPDDVSPHTLRHCFATHLLMGGGDLLAISALMGHENVATTAVYLHLDTDHFRRVYDTYHPRP